METLVLLGYPYDVWMNISASTGILLLFLIVWLETRGLVGATLPVRMLKIFSFGLICIPLFSRWFLSQSLLLVLSLLLVMVSGCIIFLRRKGL